MQITPTVLRGERVILEPLNSGNAAEYKVAALAAPELFRYFGLPMRTESEVDRTLAVAGEQMARGETVCFVTRDAASGDVAGSTSYLAIAPAHRRLEIGGTWLLPRFQGTGHNTEAKYLQLCNAFDCGAVRVEFKTDARNTRSRAAIAAIGAIEEGTLRRHMTNPDGFVRDSVYFSIIRDEWPDVRRRLEAKLEGRQGG